ncbi:peptide transporter family 1-like isoform X2 [Contarinia nasturtii]|uniref:peptide transporter family 1-like isoform X2 n=1 Tax=Contarinia nasturtii TaxID=265458 RepID=UPI0012D3CE36|nr:peptide transporter family 1-like isoform X2 [Contarinia nasturtii]
MSSSVERIVNDTCGSQNISKTSNFETAVPSKRTYPKRVFLIIGSQFCDFFNYYGLRVLVVMGKSSYTHIETSSENMIVRIFKCIKHAISTKRIEKEAKSHKRLLDYSIQEYGAQLVADIRIMKRMLVLYLPASFYRTLSEQQGSRWTLQANKMNGDVGFYIIKPDQIQALNPLLVLIHIPLFEIIVYPMLSKFGIRRPLQKMTIGGIFAGIAFLFTASVEFWIASSPEHSVSMLWQVPQYVSLGMGEIMFSVTGFAFSYEQAPASMKSVSQSFWFLTFALGNLILVLITKMNLFESQAHEFIMFAVLMFIDMFIFGIMARNFERMNSDVTIANDIHKNEMIESTISGDKW